MERNENTHSNTSGEICNEDFKIPRSDLDVCQYQQWEVNPTDNVTMSDIARTVNAFITDPGSTRALVFPKKEPVEDLIFDSIGNNTMESGSAIESTQTITYTDDHTVEDAIFHGKVILPKGVNSTNILEHRSLQTTTYMNEDVIFSKESALPTAENLSDINMRRNLQTDVHTASAVALNENTLPITVEALNFLTFSMLPTNSSMVLGKLKSGSTGKDLGNNTSTSNKLSSTIIATHQVVNRTHFFCPIKECDLKFSSKRNLDRHVNTNHKSEGFQCLKCGKRFNRFNCLEQHDNIHKGIKPYTCKTCGKKFHTHQSMYKHVKSKHSEPANKLQCEICGVVGNRSFMSKHTRRIHLKQRYHCTECQEHFRLLRYLKDHMRMHRGEEPYKCDLCSKTFVQKNSVLQHLKRHSLELKCPKCDKVFKSKDYLKGHLLQHDGIKKFCCNVCGKTFHHSHYLATHMKSHGEKGFECEICGGKFSRKDNLKSHIMRHQTTGRKNLKKR